MKKVKKKKLKFKKLFLVIILLVIFFYLANSDNKIITSISSKKVIKHDNISNYSGVGLLLQLKMGKFIKNINKMELLLGVKILIGAVLWQKMVVE